MIWQSNCLSTNFHFYILNSIIYNQIFHYLFSTQQLKSIFIRFHFLIILHLINLLILNSSLSLLQIAHLMNHRMKCLFQINFMKKSKAYFYYFNCLNDNHHRNFLLRLKEFLEIRSQIKAFNRCSLYDFFNVCFTSCSSYYLKNDSNHVLKLKIIYLHPIVNYSKINIAIHYYACQILNQFFFNFKAFDYFMKNICKNNKNIERLKQ